MAVKSSPISIAPSSLASYRATSGSPGGQKGSPSWAKSFVRYIFQAGGHAPGQLVSGQMQLLQIGQNGPVSAGISPVNWLLLSRSHSRLARLPSSGGISPVNWLSLRDNNLRLARSPSSDGIFPVNWLLPRNRPWTRPFESFVTPYHSLVKCSLNQLVLFRPVRAVRGAVYLDQHGSILRRVRRRAAAAKHGGNAP